MKNFIHEKIPDYINRASPLSEPTRFYNSRPVQ